MKKWIPIAVLLVIVLMFGSSLVGMYNTMVTKDQAVNQSWGQIEVVMQRRADLIPNLVKTVAAYAIHEQDVFLGVAKARSTWMSAKTLDDKVAAANTMDTALLNLMGRVENYPQVKANENFLALQDEMAGTENRIAIERKRFNDSVNDYNTYTKTFPKNILVSAFGFSKEKPYYKSANGADVAPKVEFNFQQGDNK